MDSGERVAKAHLDSSSNARVTVQRLASTSERPPLRNQRVERGCTSTSPCVCRHVYDTVRARHTHTHVSSTQQQCSAALPAPAARKQCLP